jgi:hypothetical protein
MARPDLLSTYPYSLSPNHYLLDSSELSLPPKRAFLVSRLKKTSLRTYQLTTQK